jgi:hypothetical protein
MKLVTSCKDCVFAIYNGNTQIGCHAGRLDNLDVAECYDEEKEFFVTKNVNCLGFRKQSWLKEDEQIDLAAERAKKELAFSYTVITGAGDIHKKLEYLNKQTHKPTATYIYGYAGQTIDKGILQKGTTYVEFQEEVKDPVNRIFKRLKKPTNVFYIDKADDISWPIIKWIDDQIQLLNVRKTIAVFKDSSSFIMPAILYTVHNTMTPRLIIDHYCQHLPETVWRL